MIKVKIQIDFTWLGNICLDILKRMIIKRAYKGYCAYVIGENGNPKSYSDFCKFEDWKIGLAFRQYFGWCKKKDFDNVRVNFKSVVLNTV